jgi:DNA-binding MarR family transcriptional regulator
VLARRASTPVARPPAVDRAGEVILKRLNMRLTYRTVRCLLFIAEHPGASNREVAEGAEIADEGQASKLLMRLAKLGLVSKQEQGAGRPNAWSITTEGEGVLRVVESS